MDSVWAANKEVLASGYKGSMAPFAQAIRESTSKEDCLARLSAAFGDWKPARLQKLLEMGLQEAAMKGLKR